MKRGAWLTVFFMLLFISLGIFIQVTAQGQNWSIHRVTNTLGESSHPAIAVGANSVAISYIDDSNGFKRARIALFNMDGGFVCDHQIEFRTGDDVVSDVELDLDGNVHVVWETEAEDKLGVHEISYEKVSGASSTSPCRELLYVTIRGDGFARFPTLAVDSMNNAHIVWQEMINQQFDLVYAKVSGSGIAVQPRPLTYTFGNTVHPMLAADSNRNLHLVWMDDTGTGQIDANRIYYIKLDNNGNPYQNMQPIVVSFNAGHPYPDFTHPAIDVDNEDNVHVTYVDINNNWGLSYTKLSNSGTIIIPAGTVPADYVAWPRVTTDSDNNAYITYYSATSVFPFSNIWNNFNVYFIKINGRNGQILTPQTILSNNPQNPMPHSSAVNSAIASDQIGLIYISYQDNALGNTEIFYRRNS